MTPNPALLRTAKLRTACALGLMSVVTTTGLVAATGTGADAATQASPYNYQARAYGTRVVGGSLPASSGKTAYAPVGCTNYTGKNVTNKVTSVDLQALRVGAVTTRSTSYRSGTSYHALATVGIASIDVGDSSGPHLSIKSLHETSHSWHSSTGYHTKLASTGLLSFTAVPGGPPVQLPFPAAGQTLTLPGLGTLAAGTTSTTRGASSVTSSGYALKLHLDASNSTVYIGSASTSIAKGNKAGVMVGQSSGSRLNLLNGVLGSGATAANVLPCRGTDGKVRTSNTVGAAVPGIIGTQATKTEVKGNVNGAAADAWTRATVADIDLGGGQAIIHGIRAVAHVHRTSSGHFTSDTTGTTPGSITVNGQTTALPAHGTYTVPGLLTVDTGVTTGASNIKRVTAVKVTLLSGTAAGSIIDLGMASTRISSH